MNKCSIFGHISYLKETPLRNTGPDNKTLSVLDHCERCRKIIGVWVWYRQHWSYFKK